MPARRWAARRASWSAALLLAGAVAAADSARGRPLSVEDLLHRETVGAIAFDPTGRWLLLERRRPIVEGARFDMGRFNRLFRTELDLADLRADGGLRSLVPRAPGFGYQVGPISPDGERAIIYRLSANTWQLGVVTFATRQVRWLAVTPESQLENRTVQWLSPGQFLALVVPRGSRPAELRLPVPQSVLPARWARTARGDVSVTAIGSGRYHGLRPPPLTRRLVAVTAATGEIRTLATGRFVDLELAPAGRRVAVMEAGEDFRLSETRPPQGDFGTATRRMSLVLVDLETGRQTRPLPDLDMLGLIAWSTSGAELLAFGRPAQAPWRDGQLVRIDAATGLARDVAGVSPAIEGRPERIFAGWWRGEPLVFGRRPGAERDDWHRLGPDGPVVLTSELPAAPRQDLVITPDALLAASGGAAWRIDAAGRATELARPFETVKPRWDGIPDRTAFIPAKQNHLSGILGLGAGPRAGWLDARGGFTEAAALDDADRLQVVSSGAAVITRGPGDQQDVVLRRGGTATPLLHLNPGSAEIERPAPIPVDHRGPDGRPLRSWLYLPEKSRFGPAPPLVVVPYPGTVYRAPPALWDDAPMAPAAALLGHGYAVLMPSLPQPAAGAGPAEGLAERTLSAIDAARTAPLTAGRFDATRLGLWGHSFGGYGVLAIIGQTDRFKAAVATAARTDLISTWGQFTPWRRIDPSEGLSVPWDAGWTESVQGGMRKPPWTAPERYLRNSPIMGAGRITTPVLLAAGEMDGSHLAQAEEMFSALFRQGKDAQLLTYWGEQHLLESPGNVRDLYARAFAFLDDRLAGQPAIAGSAAPTGGPRRGSASSAPSSPGPRR